MDMAPWGLKRHNQKCQLSGSLTGRPIVVSNTSSSLNSTAMLFPKSSSVLGRGGLYLEKWFHVGTEAQDIPLPNLLKQNLQTPGPWVIPRRDYIGCSGGWIVFYIWINCQCLKIIRFHCFSWKSWQLWACIPTWRPSAGSSRGCLYLQWRVLSVPHCPHHSLVFTLQSGSMASVLEHLTPWPLHPFTLSGLMHI